MTNLWHLFIGLIRTLALLCIMGIIGVAISTSDRTSLNSKAEITFPILKNSSMYDLLNNNVKFDFSELFWTYVKRNDNKKSFLCSHLLKSRVEQGMGAVPIIICNQHCSVVHSWDEIHNISYYSILYEIIADGGCIARVIRNTSNIDFKRNLLSNFDDDVVYDRKHDWLILELFSLYVDDVSLSDALSVNCDSHIIKGMEKQLTNVIDCLREQKDKVWTSEGAILDKIPEAIIILQNLLPNALDPEIMKQIPVPENIRGHLTIKVLIAKHDGTIIT